MEVLYARCAGCDVQKKTIKVCVLIRQADGKIQREIRTDGTTTQELLSLSDWLKEQGCTHIAMEATGVYWKPVYNLLEGHFDLLVVNARHIKAVPGRKTDVKDAEWIATLLQHGLLKASFIPSAPQRELRERTRYRVRLTEERAREVNRLQKTLEDANIKLGDVGSSVMGKASHLILTAMVNGETDPVRLALLAVGKVRADQEQLEAALTGHLDDHHRFLLGEYLQQIEHLDLAIKRLTAEITRRFTPPPPPQEGKEGPNQPPTTERAQVQEEGVKGESAGAEMPETRQEGVVSAPALLTWEQAVILASSIPGISQRAACALLAEIGINMRQFPTAGHLARFRWGLPRQ